jgi:AraC-like DNA-binding protein
MTRRANSLTERVRPTARTTEARWSMPAGDVRAFLNALRDLGYDADALLAASGVSVSELTDPDARVSCEALGTMVSLAQRDRFTPNLGLELARHTPIGAYPLLDYLVATSETVGAGVEQLARYLRLVGNPAEIETHQENGRVRIGIGGDAAPFSVEYSASLMVLHFRTETEGRFTVTALSLRHRPDDVDALARALGCEVRAESSWNGLLIPAESWRLPLRRRDSRLRSFLEAQADQILAQLPRRTGVADRVQKALAGDLSAGSTRIDACARQLAMSGRTLQRRLAGEGLSFQQLVDAARKQAAGRYLAEPTLATSEIAYLVGYSEPAAFHRAFRRWYGTTPETFRKTGLRRDRQRPGPDTA